MKKDKEKRRQNKEKKKKKKKEQREISETQKKMIIAKKHCLNILTFAKLEESICFYQEVRGITCLDNKL